MFEWKIALAYTHAGDSGGPAWNVRANAPIGLTAAMEPQGPGGKWGRDDFVTPLLEATVKEDGMPLAHSPGARNALSHGALEFIGQ
ncbi:MAG TPA: hypothetical protein VGI17_11240 [Solirubrobacterales bacterium]